MRIIRLLSLSILLAAFAQAGFAASPWHVNTNADDTDDNIGDGICHTAAGQCSLRAAIQESSFFDPSTNSIVFDAGVSTIILAGALPDLREPTTIDGTSLPGFIAGVNMVQLNGNASATAGLGLSFHAAGSVIKALVIRGCTSDGIDIGVNNVTVQQCFIGTDVTGTTDQGNGGDGIAVDSAGNVIGGTVPGPITLGGTGNVISGNAKHGIQIFSVSSLTNTVQNNFIGVNVTGTAALQNDLDGVLITGGATTTVIGDANVISGNGGNGILISGAPANTVGANHIGTDITGLVAIANGGDGVNISGVSSTGNVIGGPLLPQRNVISGNTEDGVQITGGANSNTVEGNFIGTNNPGTGAKGNGRYGILVSSDSNLIAGTVAGPQLISGNVSDGIHFVGANNNSVFTNQIGESIGGAFIPNGGAGIAVVSSGTANFVRQNNIGGNGGLGIDLSTTTSADGPNFPQDDMDPDTGPNDLQNFPVITSAISSGGVTTVTGTLNSVPNSAPFSFLIDLFYSDAADPTGFGEGQTYDKTISVNTDGLGNATFSTTLVANVPAGKFITATASNPSSSTSEFSQAFMVTVPPSADLSTTKVDSPDPVTAGTNLTYTITVTNVGPSPATTASLSDTLPAGTTFVSLSSAAGWSCSTPAVGAGGTVSCSNPSFGLTSAIFTLTVAVAPSVTAGTIITNTATASSATADPNPGNESGTATTTVATSADLSTTKVDTPDPVTAGTNLTYTITVNNAGPSDAATASLSDTLPAGTTFVSFSSPGGWSCSTPAVGAGGTVSCSNPSLTAGSAIFTLTVKVAPSVTVGTVITNTATASSTTSDPNPGNESGTATTTVATSADLSTTKVDTPDPVTAGTNLTYTITVNNAGPSDAATASLSDTLPAGTTFVSLSSPVGWTCTSPAVGAGGTVSCSNPGFTAGSAVFTLTVAVVSSVTNGTVITNTATASSSTSDPNPGNESGTATTTVATSADLSVTKVDTPDPVTAGSNITYTIHVLNAGPSDAASVVLTDTTPVNTTFVSVTAPGYVCTAPAVGGTGTISCSSTSVVNGANNTITVVVNVNPGTPNATTITNTANVSSGTADSNAGNNSATATTTTAIVVLSADLGLTKIGAPDPVVAGTDLTYTINLSSAGPDPAANVALSDSIPANTTFVSLASPAGYTCITPAVGATAPPISCTNPSVASGASDTFTLVVHVGAGTPNGSTITNSATVTTTTSDPSAANNTATAGTGVTTNADLSVTKTDSPDPVAPGANITYTIHVLNAGPSDAASAVLTDTTPANTTFVSVTAPGYVCTAPAVGGTGTISCTSNVLNGANDTITVVVNVDPATPNATTITNTANVSSGTADSNAGNNAATATTTTAIVVLSADLGLTKIGAPNPVVAGTNLTYTIHLSSTGPDPAANVALTDSIPANTTFVSLASPAGYTCTTPAVGATAPPISCTNPSVASGASDTFTLVVLVGAATPNGTIITNVASVTTTTGDPNAANNNATATTTVSVPVGTADLALTKSDSPDPVSVGSTLTYSLTVRNNGPNDATGVILTDNLPASVTFVSASAGCANVALVVTCNVGTIINGATTTLTISVTPTAPGTITNNASVTANQADPNPANSSASASTTVTAAPPANIPAASPLVLLLLALTLSLVGWYFSRRS